MNRASIRGPVRTGAQHVGRAAVTFARAAAQRSAQRSKPVVRADDSKSDDDDKKDDDGEKIERIGGENDPDYSGDGNS